MPIQISLKRAHLLCVRWDLLHWRGAPKVAQFIRREGRLEYILDLEVAMEQRGLERVHGRDALADVNKDCQNLGLGEALTQPAVHHVDNAPTSAEFH